MHWMESLETHRGKTGADSCDRRPPNVVPTAGVIADKNKIGNQVRQFRTTKIRPSKKELRRNDRKKATENGSRLFQKKSVLRSSFGLTEEYSEESKPIPHAKLLQFWEPLFSQKSSDRW